MPRGEPSRSALESSFRLGEWLVEPDLNLISRGTETVRLETKVMELLVFLASRGSRLVTRREIFDGVWGTEFICDNTLTHATSELRSALGDDARRPRFIETIHSRGYRMLVPVTSLEGREMADPGTPSHCRILCGSRSVQLRQGLNLIGRAAEATVRVDSVWVSRHHACITIDGRNATIEDLDSRNATFLNGFKLTRPMPLTDGDTICLGKLSTALRFITVGLASTDPVDDSTPVDPPLMV
jgi:DNA-binding winged helix-turn-helix (wHTH) protein